MDIKADIREWIGDKVDAVGFAPVGRFGDAPENHHPERMLKGARTDKGVKSSIDFSCVNK